MNYSELVKKQSADQYLSRTLVYDDKHLCTMPYKELYQKYKSYVDGKYVMSYTTFAIHCREWAVQKGIGLQKSRNKNVTIYTFVQQSDSKS